MSNYPEYPEPIITVTYRGNRDQLAKKKRKFLINLARKRQLAAARTSVHINARKVRQWCQYDPLFAEQYDILLDAIDDDLREQQREAAKDEGKLSVYLRNERQILHPGRNSPTAIKLRAVQELAEEDTADDTQIHLHVDL